MSRQVSVCADCGTENDIHHHNCATHEQSPALDKAAMIKLLALRLDSWPQDCNDCERTEPAGWGWQWHDVPPDCEFVLAVPGREGREWCITESDWHKARWGAGEERIDRIAQSDASGDHYPPTCADGLPCGVAHSPGDDAYCLHCPHEPKGEGGDGASALSQAMSMPSKYHVRLKGAWCDVYDVLKAFGVTNPADQHAIKKMLMPGKRGHKGGIQDRREAIQSLHRAIELEDGQ